MMFIHLGRNEALTEQNDQLWIAEGAAGLQRDMFSLEPPQARPYDFQAGVDYDASDGLI